MGLPRISLPLGGFLCVIGFIVYLLGSSSLRRLVADEGVLKLLLYRFCPPYQWWYIIRHWDETKDFFAFFVAGYPSWRSEEGSSKRPRKVEGPNLRPCLPEAEARPAGRNAAARPQGHGTSRRLTPDRLLLPNGLPEPLSRESPYARTPVSKEIQVSLARGSNRNILCDRRLRPGADRNKQPGPVEPKGQGKRRGQRGYWQRAKSADQLPEYQNSLTSGDLRAELFG